MERGLQGYLLPQNTPGEAYKTFVPNDLLPDPPLTLDTELYDLLEQANRALGRLDGITLLLPDISLFLYFYIRKEAVLSSQIEGTQSSLSDLLLFESSEVPGVPLNDVQEVSNYVAAMYYGLEELRKGEPLTLRLLKEMHSVLLSKGRGSEREPGEFRRSQNWVHGTRPGNALYVPPPPVEVAPRMGALANFLHDIPARTPTLIKAALAHVQFETIHPFLDGNGRLGRLLITLLLCHEKALQAPLLYLSLYLKTHRQEYYDLLQAVRMRGDWEAWLRFFLCGVQVTADQAAAAAQRILQLFQQDRQKIEALGRPANSALRVHHLMQHHPMMMIAEATRQLGMTKPTVANSLQHLTDLGIVRLAKPQERNRLFVYDAYLTILSEGTEPIR
jgi:Fic family protein